ncbi:hypothetical protein D3C78_964220 [compost metagenome]
MHGAPVVPEDHVALAPLVEVVEFRLADMRHQAFEQFDGLVVAQAEALRGDDAVEELLDHVEHLAAADRVGDHRRVDRIGEVGEADVRGLLRQAGARHVAVQVDVAHVAALHAERVGHLQLLQQGLGLVVEGVKGLGQVAEAGHAVFAGDFHGGQHGAVVGAAGVVQVDVPVEPADDFLAVVEGGGEPVLGAVVLQHEEFRVLVRGGDLERVHLQLAEQAAEADLAFRGDLLVAEQQDGVFVPQRLQLGLQLLAVGAVDVEAGDFDADVVQGGDDEAHGCSPYCRYSRTDGSLRSSRRAMASQRKGKPLASAMARRSTTSSASGRPPPASLTS